MQDENYRNGSLPVQQSTRVSSILKGQALSSATQVHAPAVIHTIKKIDKRVLGLGAITTIFEGTMYLFVVFWAPALISARKHNASDDPPFGLIFASFMAAMMLGSQLASRHMSSSLTTASSEDPRRSAVSRSFTAMIGLLHMGSWALSWSVFRRTELAIFLAFCTYEFAIGVYYPNMGVLKSLLVKDEHRASVYALFRLPLNCFVFTGLALTKEGKVSTSHFSVDA